MIGDANLNVS